MKAKDAEIDMLKEEIERHMQLEIKNSTLKRKVNDLGEETQKLEDDIEEWTQVHKDLEKKAIEQKSKCKTEIS